MTAQTLDERGPTRIPGLPAVPPRPSPAGSGHTFRADIQGLRAVAVGLVVLYHAGLPWLSGGFVGVDVFFVLSGFLITQGLVTELERRGTISLAGFYARRARRILPAAAVALAGTAALTVLLLPQMRWAQVAQDLVQSSIYLVNWDLADRAVDYSARDQAASPLQHFWSLAVEEQFYVVWPLAILAVVGLVRLARSRRRSDAPTGISRLHLAVPLLLIGVPSLAWSISLSAADPGRAYFVTTTRMWELALGAALAVVPVVAPASARLSRAVGWAGLAAIVWAAVTYDASTVFPGSAALLPDPRRRRRAVVGPVRGRPPAEPAAAHPPDDLGRQPLLLPLPLALAGADHRHRPDRRRRPPAPLGAAAGRGVGRPGLAEPAAGGAPGALLPRPAPLQRSGPAPGRGLHAGRPAGRPGAEEPPARCRRGDPRRRQLRRLGDPGSQRAALGSSQRHPAGLVSRARPRPGGGVRRRARARRARVRRRPELGRGEPLLVRQPRRRHHDRPRRRLARRAVPAGRRGGGGRARLAGRRLHPGLLPVQRADRRPGRGPEHRVRRAQRQRDRRPAGRSAGRAAGRGQPLRRLPPRPPGPLARGEQAAAGRGLPRGVGAVRGGRHPGGVAARHPAPGRPGARVRRGEPGPPQQLRDGPRRDPLGRRPRGHRRHRHARRRAAGPDAVDLPRRQLPRRDRRRRRLPGRQPPDGHLRPHPRLDGLRRAGRPAGLTPLGRARLRPGRPPRCPRARSACRPRSAARARR
ncbi:acyltransferase [Blastococcus sp. TML/M2B]|nr:acyltransferase [Blastococcus sp. TML/M2B]